MGYVVIIERGQEGFGAYLPDLPGCVAAAPTVDEVRHSIRQAVDMHLEDMRDRGLPIPTPTTTAELLDVA